MFPFLRFLVANTVFIDHLKGRIYNWLSWWCDL